VLNAANVLTVVRIVLIPVFVIFTVISEMTSPGWRVAAAVAFGIASATDFVDGYIARRFELVTSCGKVADPIADKALTGSALVGLSILGDLPWWVTIVILGRELGITLLRFLVIRYGVIPASRGGKLKTLTQGVAVGMYVLALQSRSGAGTPREARAGHAKWDLHHRVAALEHLVGGVHVIHHRQ